MAPPSTVYVICVTPEPMPSSAERLTVWLVVRQSENWSAARPVAVVTGAVASIHRVQLPVELELPALSRARYW